MFKERLVGGGEEEGRVPCLAQASEHKGMSGREDVDIGGTGLDLGLEEGEHGGGEFDSVRGVGTKVGLVDSCGLGDERGASASGEFEDLDF